MQQVHELEDTASTHTRSMLQSGKQGLQPCREHHVHCQVLWAALQARAALLAL